MMKVEIIIVFILKLSLFLGESLLEQDDKITNCIEHVYAPNILNQLKIDQAICVECKEGYIVSKTYKKCIESSSFLPYLPFEYCKRISQDGYCAEAIQGVELLPNNQYFFSTEMKYSERCAIVSYDYQKCLFPRFGYKLDLKTNEIFQDTEMSFCAIFDSEKSICSQFQERFVRIQGTEMGAYLGEHFLNSHYLDRISTSTSWICQSGSSQFGYFTQPIQFTKILEKYYGCSLIQYSIQIKNCKIQSHFICKQCDFSYALNENRHQCEKVISNCEIYGQFQDQNICIKCLDCFQLKYHHCFYMTGCKSVSKYDPNKITSCWIYYSYSEGFCKLRKDIKQIKNNNKGSQKEDISDTNIYDNQNGEQQGNSNNQLEQNDMTNIIKEDDIHIQIKTSNCTAYGEKYCLACKGPKSNYFDEQQNRCVPRQFSKHCRHVAFNKDICLSLQCSYSYIFDFKLIPYLNHKSLESRQFFQFYSDLIHSKFKDTIIDNEAFHLLLLEYQQLGISYNKTSSLCIQQNDLQTFVDDRCSETQTIYQQCQYCLYYLAIINNPSDNLLQLKCQIFELLQLKNRTVHNCEQYDLEFSYCLRCSEGFYFNPTNLQCELKIDNCFIHTINGKCFNCQRGFQKSKDGSSCIPICQTVQFSFNSIYYYSLFLNGNSTLSECKKNKKPCAIFQDSQCVKCFGGYILDRTNNNVCITDQNFPDCQEIDYLKRDEEDEESLLYDYQFEEKKCVQCREGYRLYAGRCFCQKDTCLRGFRCISNNCFKISNRFTNIKLITDRQKQLMKYYAYIFEEQRDQQCSKFNENNICLLCYSGYFYHKEENKCIESEELRQLKEQRREGIEDGCLRHKNIYDELKCVACKGLLFLMPDGQCYAECPKNYFTNIEFLDNIEVNICYKCPNGCKECTFNILNAYFLKAINCSQCDENYYYYPELQLCFPTCIYNINRIQEQYLICSKDCGDFFLLGEECVIKCPKFFKQSISLEGTSIQQCIDECEPPLLLYNIGLCSDRCQSGYVREDSKCLQCLQFRCAVCSNQNVNECLQCQTPFILINGECRVSCPNQQFLSEKSKCSLSKIPYCHSSEGIHICDWCLPTFILNRFSKCECPQGSFLNTLEAICEYCGLGCTKCSDQFECKECGSGYLKMEQYINNKSYISCIKNCPIGYYQETNMMIPAQLPTSQKCEKCNQFGCIRCLDKYVCLECHPQFELIKTQKKLNLFHSICVCTSQYQGDKSECKFKCSNSNRTVSSPEECCPISNCIQCNTDYSTCERCNDSAPYIFLNFCMVECPIETLAAQDSFECQKCHFLCQGCSENSKNCKACALPETLADRNNNCKCVRNMYYFENSCFERCPKFTFEDEEEMICKKYCLYHNQLPVFDYKGDFEKCESDFSHPNSKFCQQNIINLSKHILFKFEEQKENNSQKMKMIITIFQIPKSCFEFRLRGKQLDFQKLLLTLKEDYLYEQNTEYFSLESEIQLMVLKNTMSPECNIYICRLYLDIFLRNVLKQTIKLQVNFNSRIIEYEGTQDSDIILNQMKHELQLNKIDQEQFLPFIYQLDCKYPNICDYTSLLLEPSTPVQFNLYPQFPFGSSENTIINLYPFAIYLQTSDNIQIPIDEFYFNNSQPSSLKLTILINFEAQGKLIVILKDIHPLSFLIGLDHFFNSNNNNNRTQYLIIQSDIEVDKKINLQQQNQREKEINDLTNQKYIIWINAFVSCIVLLFILLKCLNMICRTKQQQQQTDIHDDELQINHPSRQEEHDDGYEEQEDGDNNNESVEEHNLNIQQQQPIKQITIELS